MADSREHSFAGTRGGVTAREWPCEGARYVVLLVHGYGEHVGRYEHVADALVRHGAAVFGPDHMGHGRSAGERVLIEDFEDVVTDVRTVEVLARDEYPDLPVVLIGHSMGGLIAARYAQRYGAGLAAVVLSGPLIGIWEPLRALLAAPEAPKVPLDPKLLSRDMAVGAAYANDPLVWHGPFKRPTLEAIHRGLETVSKGGPVGALPLLWLHGDDDRIVPLSGSRTGIEEFRGAEWTERIYPGARHEVLNETNKGEVLADVKGFVDAALGR
ncbi:alpha/beta hydrolase [Streptomyces scabiei]|uniref:alpha/beta hydrolase n=1 Tax=Streptomyces scabiei TaxID=1930 RepID=UPI0029A145E5|nr:alpha/beta hydrolase [Streptomyces scabiei]MDX3520652.1 lysophospholipase [Streptomyces scabiei]